jgi:hypothetical protein
MSIILSHYHYMQYNYIRLIIIHLIIIKVTAQSQCWEPNTQFEVISVSSRLVSIETFENERNGNFPSNLNCWVIHQLSLSIQPSKHISESKLVFLTRGLYNKTFYAPPSYLKPNSKWECLLQLIFLFKATKCY